VTSRIVVWGSGIDDPPWQLPASVLVDRPWIGGGERTLYEIAVASASLGLETELRGVVARRQFEELCEAVGARPEVGNLPERDPAEGDIVVLWEGHRNTLPYLLVSLSPARGVIAVLAAPGLFGPGLEGGFSAPDPLTVDLDSLALPRHYHAMDAFGFDLWTNSPAVKETASRAGVDCSFIGTGQPLPFPDPGPKTNDVAIVGTNRWVSLARQVGDALGFPYVEIPEGDRVAILAAFAASRILVLPSRVEGQSRLQLEARAVGCIPVALSTNRFAAGMDDSGGAVLVPSVEEMPDAVRTLLADPERLEARAARAVRTAREQVDWDAFVRRLASVVERPPRETPARVPASALREGIAQMAEEATDLRQRVRDLEPEIDLRSGALAWLLEQRNQAERRSEALVGEVEWLRGVAARAEEERSQAARDFAAFKRRRSIRAALAASRLLRPVARKRSNHARGADGARTNELGDDERMGTPGRRNDDAAERLGEEGAAPDMWSEVARLAEDVARLDHLGRHLTEQHRRSSLHARVFPTMAWIEAVDVPESLLVSVVLPTQDRSELLARAIDSVLRQSYGRWELLVVNDGRLDAAEGLVGSVGDDRIRLLHGDGRGPAAARNVALAAAKGDVIVYLDDDNRIHPAWLRSVVWAFSGRSDANVLYGARAVDDPSMVGVDAHEMSTPIHLEPFDLERLRRGNYIDIGTLAHRQGLEDARFDEELLALEDWELMLRLTRNDRPLVLPVIAVMYATTAPRRLSAHPELLRSLEILRKRGVVAPDATVG
jgi:hypothetical protein